MVNLALHRLHESLKRENETLRDAIARLSRDPDDPTQATWDAAERNAIDEIVCRVHPDGADAIESFWRWYEPQRDKWLGPHRACGAWLAKEVRRERT